MFYFQFSGSSNMCSWLDWSRQNCRHFLPRRGAHRENCGGHRVMI